MTPAARTQAAIELLDRIITAAREGGASADTLIARYFAERRYAGSKDRRAVRELVYAVIRENGAPPPSGRAGVLGLARYFDAFVEEDWYQSLTWLSPDLFDGGPHAPEPIGEYEGGWRPVPWSGWAANAVHEALHRDSTEMTALYARAPLDLRVNTLLTTPGEMIDRFSDAEPIPDLPHALRLPAGSDVSALAGFVEVQDAGSQIVTLAAGARPGMEVVDLCAGGGGKTLSLAAAMANNGRILATDTDRTRLQRLPPRAERARVTIVETRLLDPGEEAKILADEAGRADVVLIDAPCSGTGTWRRNPEARWRLTPDRLRRLTETQRHLMAVGARLVKPGGALVYIVCSLLDDEGAGQVDRFLAAFPGWSAEPLNLPAGRPHGPGVRLTPAHDATDGFFVARLVRPC